MSNNVSESLVSKKLQLSVISGVTASGAAKLATKSFANLNADASVENMHSAAKALGSLYAYDLAKIFHSEKYLLESVEVSG